MGGGRWGGGEKGSLLCLWLTTVPHPNLASRLSKPKPRVAGKLPTPEVLVADYPIGVFL